MIPVETTSYRVSREVRRDLAKLRQETGLPYDRLFKLLLQMYRVRRGEQ
jgi:hypothetical protein